MKHLAALAACALAGAAPRAHADDAPPAVDRAREHFDRGEFAEAKRLLVEAYEAQPDPALLFALGQVEIGLRDPAAAIVYYERYLATNPPPDQAGLARQALDVARGMQLAQPAPAKPIPRRVTRRRPWDVQGTGLVVLGGTAVAGGTGLFLYGRHLGNDRSGTLGDYDERAGQARSTQWIAAGVAAAGAIVIAGAIVRWRISTETVEVTAGPTGVALGGRW